MRTSASFLSSDLNANPHPLEIVCGSEQQEIEEELRKEIAERAYRLYDANGRPANRHTEHWLQAEREILQRITQVRESGSWIIVNLHVPNVPAEGFKLLVNEERALVEVEEPLPTRRPAPRENASRFFYIAQWPAAVDPTTASAYVKSGTLTLEVKLISHPSEARKIRSANAQSS